MVLEFPLRTTQHKLREFIGLVNFYRLHPELCHHYPTSELHTQSGHPTFLHGLRMQQQLSLILNMLLLTPHSSSITPPMHLQVALRMLLMSRWGAVLQYSNGQWCPLSFSPGLYAVHMTVSSWLSTLQSNTLGIFWSDEISMFS